MQSPFLPSYWLEKIEYFDHRIMVFFIRKKQIAKETHEMDCYFVEESQ